MNHQELSCQISTSMVRLFRLEVIVLTHTHTHTHAHTQPTAVHATSDDRIWPCYGQCIRNNGGSCLLAISLLAMTPLTTSRPHVLAPSSRRNDMLAKQPPSGALDSGHVTVAIVSAIPGLVYMLTAHRKFHR